MLHVENLSNGLTGQALGELLVPIGVEVDGRHLDGCGLAHLLSVTSWSVISVSSTSAPSVLEVKS